MHEHVQFNGLVGVLETPNEHAPIIILCHGLASSKDSGTYLGLEHGFAALGIGTFRFDFHGHGESEGKFEDFTLSRAVEDVKAAFDYLRERFPHARIGLTGSSIGGAAVYYAAASLDVCGVAAMCPALENQKLWKKRAGAAKIKEWKTKGSITYTAYSGRKLKLKYDYYEDAGQYDPRKVEIKAPLVIIHGDKDQIVPYNESKKLCKERGFELVTIKGADHNFSQQKDAQIDAVIHFFTELCSINPEHTHGKIL